MMTATHLAKIVGHEAFENNKSLLYSLLSVPDENLEALIHLLWITNRQQGKTCLLARFLAAILMVSPIGGELVNVYATKFLRAQSLIKDAKRYLVECQSNPSLRRKLAEIGVTPPRFGTENTQTYSVFSCIGDGVENFVKACPQTVKSCRGDAPEIILADEAAFLDRDYLYVFMIPLLAVKGRVATFVTTPPGPDDHFTDFINQIKAKKSVGGGMFTIKNHSLLCDDCFEAGNHRCFHNLAYIPPYKSALRIEEMLRVMPEAEMEQVKTEVYGRLQASDGSYFNKEVLTATILDTPELKNPDYGASPIVFISIDPPSHHVSEMGLWAGSHTTRGESVVIGASSVKMERCNVIGVELCVRAFASKVLSHHTLRRYHPTKIRVVPIVEANNNGILAEAITNCIESEVKRAKCVWIMPFVKEFFKKDIVADVGVLCTESNKLHGILTLFTAMVKRQVRFAERIVTIGPVHLLNSTCPTPEAVKLQLHKELSEFKDDKKGKVSGRTANNRDDVAMAWIQGAEWSDVLLTVARHVFSR